MERRLASAAERYLNSRHQNKRRTQVLRVLAVLVVLFTVSALIMPAVTMSNEVECGLEEHAHTDGCYAVQMAAPQPRLACTAGASGETLIHSHDSWCYNAQGELTCTLPELAAHVHGPECYQERRELTCQEIQDQGHTHTGSCYAYEKGGLTCGLEEGGGHIHTPECYPVERAEEPLCGQEESDDIVDEATGQVLAPGHRHTSECWERRVDSMLVCGREESDDVVDEATGEVLVPGHRHGPECWLSGDELCYQRGCGQHEGQGHTHTHTEECYGWAQTEPLCGEVERPAGHIHDDSCYNITQVLTCHTAELEPHTHDIGCYTEGGVLICGRPEIAAHQHAEACFTTPPGGPEEARILTCGKEEHTHTDLCYVRAEPEETETFYCGLEEHIHNLEECYFPSGALKCTLGEHVHDMTCMIPPVEESDDPLESGEPSATDDPLASQDPVESGEPEPSESMEPERREFWVEESIPYQTDAFQVTFQVQGWVKPALDSQETAAADNETWVNDFGPGAVSTPSYEEGLVELVSQNIPLGALPVGYSASLDPDALPGADPFAEYNQPAAETGPAGPVGSVVDDNRPFPVEDPVQAAPEAGNEPVVTPAPIVEPTLTPAPEASFEPAPAPEAEEQLELVVEQLEENDPEYQRVAANAQTELGEEESTVVDVLRVAFYAGNQKMDLSGCEVTVVIEATQEMKDAMEAQMAVTADENGPLPGEDAENQDAEGQEEEEASFVMTDERGSIVAFAKVSEPMVVTLSDSIMALSAVPPKPYPVFQVQYYAYLDAVDKKPGTDAGSPTLINTENGGTNGGGKLPVNGNLNLPAIHMEVDDNGTIKTLASNGKVTKIFNTHKFSYETAPHRNYIDIVTKQGGNYKLAEIWVMEADGETVKKDADSKEMKYTHTAEKPIQLTNNATTAGKYPDEYVLVEDNTILRLVYKTTDGDMDVKSNFHDYDVSDGKVYNSANKNDVAATRPGQNSSDKYMYTKDVGIHTPSNYSGTGAKYAFGNGTNVATGLGTQKLNNYYINQATNGKDKTGKSFQNCSFKLVQDTLPQSGELQFSSGIAAPNLFSGSAVGRTDYDGNLGFTRKGDTYTLSTASVGGNTLGNLDKLAYGRMNFSKTAKLFSNEFWPLDKVASAGTAGHDLMFGKSDGQHKTFGDGTTHNTLVSDYNYAPQNGIHNPYFGMNFSVDFTVYPDYVGPLEYYFFGDDDMWVYLSKCDKNGNATEPGRLICDIGGVHGAVGEYVNLWDYISKDDKLVDDTKPDETTRAAEAHYKLTFFYTERGASGSTCWMQFTLPELRSSTFRTPTSTDYATLEIGKKVEGPPAKGQKFRFTLELRNADGSVPTDITASVYRTGGSAGGMGEVEGIDWQKSNGILEFDLEDGQTIFLKDLPKNIQYTVTENTYEGYAASYVTTDEDLNSGGKNTKRSEGTVASGTLTGGHSVDVMCWNTASYELPSTGGAGPMYTMACVPLLAAACLWYKKKSKGEEAAL